MEPEQIQATEPEPLAPTGEDITPEPTEAPEKVTTEAPVASDQDEHAQEIADLQAAVEAADTPENKAAQQAKLNTKFAEMRRDRRDSRKAAEEARIEAARWKGRAEALAEIGQKKEPEQAPVQPEPDDLVDPELSDYEDYDDYNKAVTKVEVARAIRALKAEFAAKEAARAQTEADKAKDAWLSKGKEKFSDFDAVVTKPYTEGGPAISTAMAEVINGSEVSHELAYHLAKNQAESLRIANLPPMMAAKELGKLEAKLSGIAPVKPKKQTNAPAPINPIAGDGATAEVTKKPEDMTTPEYIAAMDRKEFGSRKK